MQVTGTIEATSRGRDVIQLMRKGHLKGLSIGFTPTETDRTPQGLTYTRAQLHELSLTPLPAYGDQSTVTATREEEPAMSESTETREAPQVDLAPLTERLDQLESRMARATDTQVREIAPVDALAMQLRDAVEAKKIRALGDVVSGGNAGVLPPTWSSLLRGYLDGNRYLTPRLGSLAFPATGHTLTVPAISQEPTVGPRGTELTAIPGTAMTTDSDTYTAKWIAGGVRVALELVSQSSPEASAVAVQRLLLAYSREAEDTIATDLTTAAVKTGAALDFTDYGTFVDSVLDAAHTIRDVTGAFGDKLALSAASWKSLIGLVDADGRRILSVSGPSNADGSGALTTTSVNVGGVECFYYLGSADLQFNTMSAAYAEKPPTTLRGRGRRDGPVGGCPRRRHRPAAVHRRPPQPRRLTHPVPRE